MWRRNKETRRRRGLEKGGGGVEKSEKEGIDGSIEETADAGGRYRRCLSSLCCGDYRGYRLGFA